MFLETSALTGENVEETFLKCARSILTKVESGKFMVMRKVKIHVMLVRGHVSCEWSKSRIKINSKTH